ncbi:MAG: HlyD family secretion protein [Deltaproteobacteria bacterium]
MSEPFQNETRAQGPAIAEDIPGGPAALSKKVKSLRLSDAAMRDGSGGSKLPWFLCLVLAGSTAYFAWKVYGTPGESMPPMEADVAAAGGGGQPAATAAKTESARPGGVVLLSTGYVVPAHQILVSPKVNGMVKYLRVHKPDQLAEQGLALEEGLRVTKGDILAQLESTDYESDVARCRALLAAAEQRLSTERKNIPQEIDRAQAELNENIANRDYAKTALERNIRLAKSNSVSPIELEKSQTDYDAARHRVERLERALEIIRGPRAERIKVAEAEVSSAKADLVKAEWRLDNCTIVAPITGTILKKNVEEGNVVNPVAFNGSFSVCDMADLSDLEVDMSIQERDISQVFVNQRCVVRSRAYPDRPYDGRVSRLMPIADRAKGSVSVRVKIRIPAEEEGVYIKPEMSADVSFYAADATPPTGTSPGETAEAALEK